jgi:hypothetical protein
MPTELKEKPPQNAAQDSANVDVKFDPVNPIKFPDFTLNTFNHFPSGDLTGYGFLSSELFKLKSGFEFNNGNTFGAYSDFKVEPYGLNLQKYGFDTAFKLGEHAKATGNIDFDNVGQTLTGKASVNEKENIYNLGGQLNTANGAVNYLNADATVKFSNTVNGNANLVYDGLGQTLTGKATVNEKENIYNLGGQLNTANGVVNNLNADASLKFSDTVKGNGNLVYDGLGQTLTGKASVNERENIYNLGGQLNTANGVVNNLSADATVKFSNTVNGNGSLIYDGLGQTLTGKATVNEKENIYNLGGQLNTGNGLVNNLNADASLKFSDTVKGNGSLIYDGLGQTLTGKATVNEKENIYILGGQVNTANGVFNNLNAGATLKFSDTVKGTGSLVYDGLGQTFTGKLGVTEKANTYNFGTQFNTATGSLNSLNADASIKFSDAVKGNGSLVYDGAGQTLTGKFGVAEKNNAYNFGTQFNTATGSFNSISGDAKFGFNNGAGSIRFDGNASAKMLEAGAAINYKNSNIEYSAQARFNNQSGAFGLSEVSGKLSTVGNSNHKLSVEAGYKPFQNDAYVKVGYTFSFGSPVTKPISPQQFATQSTASIDREVARFRDLQSIVLLSPQDKKLHDQALAGVEKLNAGGAGLPLAQTAASLTALAKNENLSSIGYVSLGKETPNGQNLIIGDSNNPNNPAGNRAHISKNEAINTPVADSVQKLQQQNTQTPLVTEQPGPKKNQFHM